MTEVAALHAVAFLLGLFAAVSGLNFWIVGVAPGRSAPWWKQNAWAAFFLTVAVYLLVYAFTGSLPY